MDLDSSDDTCYALLLAGTLPLVLASMVRLTQLSVCLCLSCACTRASGEWLCLSATTLIVKGGGDARG